MQITRKRLFKIKSGKNNTYKKIKTALKSKKKRKTFRKTINNDLSNKTLKNMRGGGVRYIIDSPYKYALVGKGIVEQMNNAILYKKKQESGKGRKTRANPVPTLPLNNPTRFMLRFIIQSFGKSDMQTSSLLGDSRTEFTIEENGTEVLKRLRDSPSSVATKLNELMNELIYVKGINVRTKSNKQEVNKVVQTTYGQLILSKMLEIVSKAKKKNWNFKYIDGGINEYLTALKGSDNQKYDNIIKLLDDIFGDVTTSDKQHNAEKKINNDKPFHDSKIVNEDVALGKKVYELKKRPLENVELNDVVDNNITRPVDVDGEVKEDFEDVNTPPIPPILPKPDVNTPPTPPIPPTLPKPDVNIPPTPQYLLHFQNLM